jgi:ribosomal protein L40E
VNSEDNNPDTTDERNQVNATTGASNTKSDVKKSIRRCPKCRSINPPDAQYCQHCGKVFSSKPD